MEPNVLKPTRVYSIDSGPEPVENSASVFRVNALISKDFGETREVKEYLFPDEESANAFVERTNSLPQMLEEDIESLMKVLTELHEMKESGDLYHEIYDGDDLSNAEDISEIFKSNDVVLH